MATDLEMNKWGVFLHAEDGHIHIAPTNEEGWLVPPHKLVLGCKCCPRLEEDFVIHDWIN
jgi:hypothetical protein